MATGVELATAWVRLVPTVEGISEEISREVGRADVDGPASEAGSRYSNGFGKSLKVGLAAAAGLAIAGVAAVFKTGLEEIKFGEEISAQTDQLIKNTGAGFSTQFVEDYTLALSGVSGIAEEDLQAAGNSILKFGDVSEDTYKRSVDAINNMGSAGKDVAGTSEALGKALADPAKAAALLKRQGVLLNEEQQGMIASFTEAGDKAGAQGVILDALEGTYGGMAEAAGGTTQGQINKLTNTFENLSAVAVTAVMPAVSGILEGLTGFFGWVQQNQGILPVFATIIGVVLVAAFIAWTASIWAATAAMLANPITWIILAIVALIAIVILLVMNWDTVVAFLTDVWNGFISWFTGVMDGFLAWWNGLWTAVWEWIVSVWNNIVLGVTTFFSLLFLGIQVIGDAIAAWWNGMWEAIGSFLMGIWSNIVGFVTGYINMVQAIIVAVVTTISGIWNSIWSGISSFFIGIWNSIIAAVGSFQGAFAAAFSGVASVVSGAFEGVAGIVKGAINGVIGIINGAIDGINTMIGVANNIPGVAIPTLGKIPKLAQGGIVSKRPGGIPAIIGEGRYDEAVVPLSPSNIEAMSGGGGGVKVEVINKSGAALGDLIEMYIVQNETRNRVSLENGLAR